MEQENFQTFWSDVNFIIYNNNKVFCSKIAAAMVTIVGINRAFWLDYDPFSGRGQTSDIGKAVRCP